VLLEPLADRNQVAGGAHVERLNVVVEPPALHVFLTHVLVQPLLFDQLLCDRVAHVVLGVDDEDRPV